MTSKTQRAGSSGSVRRSRSARRSQHSTDPDPRTTLSRCSRSVAGTVGTVAGLFAVLVAVAHPQAVAVLTGTAVAGYALARLLGRYARGPGLPMPGTGARLRVFTDRRRDGHPRTDRAWSLTVTLQHRRSN